MLTFWLSITRILRWACSIASARADTGAARRAGSRGDEPVFATKALRKFLGVPDVARVAGARSTSARSSAATSSFFGEQLGCKIFVEDIFADLDRHVRDRHARRACRRSSSSAFRQARRSVDGILCWDLIDYLDRAVGAGARRRS